MTTVRNGSNRVTVYPNEIALEADVLRTNMYKMADIAFLAQTLIGNGFELGDAFGGLPCTPTASPSLNVRVGPGAMYSYQDYEATNWSTITADTTNKLYKQAANLSTISTATTSLFPGGPITAPVSSGHSVYWIIEAQFATQDLNVVSNPYYNPSNPAVPQFESFSDTRQDYISFRLKQGTPYVGITPDVTQIPAPDAGYTGMYALFLTFGQTTITSGNITVYPDAPFIVSSAEDAMTFSDFQKSYPIYGDDTGIADAYIATTDPVPDVLEAGVQIDVLIANTNITSAPTLDAYGFGAEDIITTAGVNANPGDLTGGVISSFKWNGTKWVLMNPQSCLNRIAYAAKVSNSTTEAISFSSPQKCTFNTVEKDDYEIFDVANNQFKPLIPGWYSLSQGSAVGFAGATATFINFRKNDVFLDYAGSTTPTMTSTSGASQVYMNGTTDTLQLYVIGSSGDTIIPTFSIAYLGR